MNDVLAFLGENWAIIIVGVWGGVTVTRILGALEGIHEELRRIRQRGVKSR